MQLSKEEWRRAAELSAAAEDGRKRAGQLKFRRFGAAPTAALIGVGTLGFGAWWVFSHLIDPILSGTGPRLSGHLPAGFVLVSLLALVVTIVVFRVRYLSTPLLIVRALGVTFIWLGLAAYAVAMIA